MSAEDCVGFTFLEWPAAPLSVLWVNRSFPATSGSTGGGRLWRAGSGDAPHWTSRNCPGQEHTVWRNIETKSRDEICLSDLDIILFLTSTVRDHRNTLDGLHYSWNISKDILSLHCPVTMDKTQWHWKWGPIDTKSNGRIQLLLCFFIQISYWGINIIKYS